MTKDYYRILGVLDDAEDIVIKAAYKALAQRYHPDKWVGDKDEATRRMSDINEAYGVLSDPVKRKEYDSTRDKNSYQAEPEDDELSSSVDSDWKKVCEYVPDLVQLSARLARISVVLESSFKVLLLEKKQYMHRQEIAEILEKNYFEKYFGNNPEVIKFARHLILNSKRDAAAELNKVVVLLGSDVEPELIISKIKHKYKIFVPDEKTVLLAKEVIEHREVSDCQKFVEMLGGETTTIKHILIGAPMFDVKIGGISTRYHNDEFINYAGGLAFNYLQNNAID